MPSAREKTSLNMVEYDIAGNAIRAYYDAAKKLIFVLDETVNADKPNVLLVIDSFDGRKWDDVLVNDYDVDLESVRPKRDNKYQKLDIEYGGLDVYADLIAADKSGDDLSGALDNLTRFRVMSVRRSAKERLVAANDAIVKSNETIERTNETIAELKAKIKELRGRVAAQRREIGREPTKASAAKILKTEAQIDATNEKLARAKKRLVNAQRRLTTAEDDAEIARALLARDVPKMKSKPTAVAVRKNTEPMVVKKSEPRAKEIDNEEEVKPLFDKDPENLDDSIAFKPIDFGANEPADEPVAESASMPVPRNSDDVVAPAPLSFTPPEKIENDADVSDESNLPVLDTLTPEPIAAVPELPAEPEKPIPADLAPVAEPKPALDVAPVVSETGIVATANEPVTPITPVAPVTPVRPVSPVVGDITPVEQKTQKSTVMYYILLVLLIVLSIGTLWLYQKSTVDNVPDLARVATETVAPVTTATQPEPIAEPVVQKTPTPFVAETSIVKATVSSEPAAVDVEPVAVDVKPIEKPAPVETTPVAVEPEPVVVVEPEPVALVANVVSEPVIEMESPFVMPKTVATYEPEKPRIPTEEEVIASKPGYNVSQNDEMFVASDEYDTETIYSDDVAEMDAVEFKEPTVVPAEPALYNQVASIVSQESAVSECEGGASPDSLGCCPGEEYTYTDDGFMCCNSDECFPPLE